MPTSSQPLASSPFAEAAATPRSAPLGLRRGLQRRCPECGAGALFQGYLKVQPTCSACGHDNGRYRADDGPAYFTILLIGHLVVAPLFALSIVKSWSPLILLLVGMPLVGAATLASLPFIKGGWIGVLWGTSSAADEGPAARTVDP